MRAPRALVDRGWRRTGAINIVWVSTCGLIVLAGLLYSIARNENGSKLHSTKIYQGRCPKSSRISTVLHLLVNIVSTGILASSNFFMHITTSPTRKEIDRAHMFLRPLDIGLLSRGNLSSLSYFKRACWSILLLSSIPIHLFFNSAIYNTVFQGDSFDVAIATKAFTQNKQYWAPGASLTPSGASSPVQIYQDVGYENPSHNYEVEAPLDGYGSPVHLNDYRNKSSDIRHRIDDLAQQGSKWEFLDKPRGYRGSYSDLIITISGGTNDSTGWLRSEVYEFVGSNSSYLRDKWDSVVPPDQVNPLWFWAQCEAPSTSLTSCSRILSQRISFIEDGRPTDETNGTEMDYGYKAIRRELEIEGCLAKPVETCQVLVSNGLLIAVLFCVFLKIVTCVAILLHQQDASFITPGDAIESFITDPDIYTRGLATLSIKDSQRLQCSTREVIKVPDETYFVSSTRPRRWNRNRRPLSSAILQGTWIEIYFPSTIALLGLLAGWVVGIAAKNSSLNSFGDFGPSKNIRTVNLLDGLGYVATLICINMPQLILSFIYLTINMLHTQLQVEKEWNSYGLSYRPLRVSYPKGQQTSTYWLQLPFRYSIPMIGTSALLHWLIRSDIEKTAYNERLRNEFRLPEDTFVGMGYSDTSMFILLLLGPISILSPLLFRQLKIQSDMVFGGTNSLILSAACHIPRAPSQLAIRTGLAYTEEDGEYLISVSRQPLRWGVRSLPTDLSRDISVENDEPVMHLSFGTEDHDVQEPQPGGLYA
ncbi:uncharacterized protein PG986_008716 [Apiospora aurea]|uniref:DUF6536 domain-containing protein n=1 Tax=Apiospora aurea TaxID=335848 RepID=A0ABR1Q5V7_9PEZI